jgi:hypothetical protein
MLLRQDGEAGVGAAPADHGDRSVPCSRRFELEGVDDAGPRAANDASAAARSARATPRRRHWVRRQKQTMAAAKCGRPAAAPEPDSRGQ